MVLIVISRHYLLIYTLLTFYLQFLNCSTNSFPATENCPTALQNPKITILSDSKDFLAGDGKLLFDKTLFLRCIASYPIYWNFSPPSASKIDIDSKMKAGCYSETLSVSFINSTSRMPDYDRTGNYTCTSGLDAKLTTSIFLHIRDNNNLFHGRLHARTKSISVETDFWSIPCIATVEKLDKVALYQRKAILDTSTPSDDLDVGIILEDDIYYAVTKSMSDTTQTRENNTNTNQKHLQKIVSTTTPMPEKQMGYTKYDPRYGFLLLKSEFQRPHGLFECQGVFGNITDVYNVTLQDYTVYPSGHNVIYSDNNTIEIICASDEDIKLDLSKAYQLKVLSSSKTKTQSFKYSLRTLLQETGNVTMIPYHSRYQYINKTTGVISCVNINSSKILYSWNHDLTKIVKCSFGGLREDAISGEVEYTRSRFSLYNHVTGSCENVIGASVYCYYADTITLFLSRLAQGYFHFNDVNYFSSIGRQNDKNYTTTSILCQTFTDVYYTFANIVATSSGFRVNPPRVDEDKNIKVYIRKAELIEYMLGDVMEIWCVASRYIFTDSIHWNANFKNGTSSPLEGIPLSSVEIDSNILKIPLQWAYVGKVQIQMNEHLLSVSCSAVAWNSTKTVTVKYFVNLNQTAINKDPYEIISPYKTKQCETSSPNPVIVMNRKILRTLTATNTVDLKRRLVGHIVTDMNVRFRNFASDFVCYAEYPTEWAFQGVLTSSTLSTVDTYGGNISLSSFSPCFQNQIITSSYASSGEYVCRKKNDHSIFSSVYVYIKSDAGGIRFVNSGNHINVFADVNEPTTLLPCRVNDPDASVDLYYYDGPGNYRKLVQPEFQKYDPRKGFFIATSLLNKSAVYMCTLNNSTAPQTSVSISIQMAAAKTSVKEDLKTNALLHSNEDNTLSGKLDQSRSEFLSLHMVTMGILISIVGLLSWIIKRQRQNNENASRTLGSYIQLNNSL